MSRLVPQADMSADEIVKCCIQARAGVRLCEAALWNIQNGSDEEIPQLAEDVQFALQLVADLLVPVQEALESHEGLKGGREMIADAHLIELGRQFEAAKAAAVPLDRKRKAAIARREKAYADAGIPHRVSDWEPTHRKLADKIDRQSGTGAAYEAFSAKHNVCIRLMRAIHKAKATTLEGFAVKAAAVAFDQADFDVDAPVPSDVAERELYRLARDMAKAVKGDRNG